MSREWTGLFSPLCTGWTGFLDVWRKTWAEITVPKFAAPLPRSISYVCSTMKLDSGWISVGRSPSGPPESCSFRTDMVRSRRVLDVLIRIVRVRLKKSIGMAQMDGCLLFAKMPGDAAWLHQLQDAPSGARSKSENAKSACIAVGLRPQKRTKTLKLLRPDPSRPPRDVRQQDFGALKSRPAFRSRYRTANDQSRLWFAKRCFELSVLLSESRCYLGYNSCSFEFKGFRCMQVDRASTGVHLASKAFQCRLEVRYGCIFAPIWQRSLKACIRRST